jgi:diguanylate cyclase (GGDEF)-like protein
VTKRRSRGPVRFGRDLRAAAAAVAVVTLLTLLGTTWRVDERYYDWLVARSGQPADDRIVIVAVDPASLAAMGRWPWPRRMHAQLLDRLGAAGVAGVGMAIQFAEPDPDDLAGDAELADAIRRLGRVVLPVWAEPVEPYGPPVEILPLPALLDAGAQLGHVATDSDADGIVRQAHLMAGLGEARWPALAATLHRLVQPEAPTAIAALPGLRNDRALHGASALAWVRDHSVRVPFAASDGFAQVSYVDVLEGRVAADQLEGRWVLVGVTAAGIGQVVYTPLRDASAPLSGVEYQAHLLNMLAADSAITAVPTPWQLPAAIALVLLPVLVLLRAAPLPALHASSLLAITALLAMIGSALLLHAGIWFPPFAVVATLVLALAVLLAARLQESRHLARSDALTGLANRHLFELMLERELAAVRRTGRPLSLLLVDVDHFKHFNDACGHRAGDEMLRAIARVVRRHARRPRDLAARYGGDELAVLLPETPLVAASALAERMVAAVQALAIAHPGSNVAPVVTLSIGVACEASGDADRIALLDRADAALYRAKELGRNRSCCAAPDATDAPGAARSCAPEPAAAATAATGAVT